MIAYTRQKNNWQLYLEVVFLYKTFTLQGNPVTHKYPVTAFKWVLLIPSGHISHFNQSSCATGLKSEHITEQHNENMTLKWAHSGLLQAAVQIQT